MTTENQVHWCEGLFLQPHHLQAMQKGLQEEIAGARRSRWAYPYGVVKMGLSDADLANHRLRFDALHVVMPSGREVQVPENADLASVDIKETLAAHHGLLKVKLGVPLWQATGRNVLGEGEDWRTKRLYRIEEVERVDENSGKNPQVIRVRKINARLLFEGDDESDLEVLPLLRIIPAQGEDGGFPRVDPKYIPPCLVVNGSAKLRDLLRDITSQVLAHREALVLQATRGGVTVESVRGTQLEQVLRLRTLNRWGALLDSLGPTLGAVPPLEMYGYLRQLLGELAAHHPGRDAFEVSPYNHDDPFPVFDELLRKIPPLLTEQPDVEVLKAPFVRDEGTGVMWAALNDEALSRPNEYYLGIETKMDPKQLALLVEDADKFKLMPRSIVFQRVYGVKLVYESHPPVELPPKIGLSYFRLVRHESGRMWDRIVQEKAVAATWPEADASDFRLTLFMPVP
ncbi:MAG: type VI secretion system baseplate subunit TssK [Planctomycetes bacterium]|jgi:type VI secretion system ImpJ/VasE family protein|nr:type VI secretion system baseplate subunit TssK [Planctomycetota bacterium]